MFMGEHSHSIDVKGRLILPVKFREELGEKFVITRGLDSCLTVYTLEDWAHFASEMSKQATTKANVRSLKRFFFGGAAEVECDKQGRILIPAHLRSHAKLERDVVVVGAADKVEIWSRPEWDAYNLEIGADMESIAESLDTTLNFGL